MANMVGAFNKPFDYMACGLPLLVTILPDWILWSRATAELAMLTTLTRSKMKYVGM
jgi:hypothetical protein